MNEQLEQLLSIAKKKGAVAAEAYQIRSQTHPVFFEGNRLKQLESSQSQGTALRLWQDDRPGLAVAYGLVEPELLVDRAIALSRLNLPETIELGTAKTLIYQEEQINLSVEDLVKIGRDTIATLRDKYSEVICSAELEKETETTTIINSQGLYCQYQDISLSYDFGVELVRGEDFLTIYDGEYSKEEINLDLVVESIIQRLDWAKNNVPVITGKIPVLLTANAATMLWETVSAALNGKRVWEGSSPWSDRSGDLVISELLNISQQSNLKPYNCPVDDEGTPTQDFSLISNGRLQRFYCDRTIAKQLGIENTGNGFRPDLESYPSPSLVNLVVQPGRDGSFLELISQLNRGIIVDQILGGGADISGDFSVNVDLGYRVEQGEVIGRIKDVAIAGNVYDILQQVITLGSVASWSGSCYTPPLIVSGVSVVG